MGAFLGRLLGANPRRNSLALALVFGGVAVTLKKRAAGKAAAKAKRRAATEKEAQMSDEDLKKAEMKRIKKLAKKRIWAIIWPKSLFSKDGLALGSMLAFHVFRVWQNLRLTKWVKEGDRVIFNRQAGAYWKNQRLMLWLAVEMATARIFSVYLKKILSLTWREKLARECHEAYFRGNNFYHIENSIKDVDVRMTEEVTKVADGFAEFLNAGLLNLSSATFYLGKLWYEYGALSAFTPSVWIFVANIIAHKLAPLDYSLFGIESATKAAYKNAQTRLVVHSEAIAALRGAKREETILGGLFDRYTAAKRAVYKHLLKHSVLVELLVHRLMWTFTGWFIIGPGVFNPRDATDMTIGAITEVRAEVGYKFILYIQVVIAAMTGANELTNYGKLQGEAGRIVELLHTLKTAEPEGEATFASGDRIGFDHVDVHTPTGHLLVKDLTFEVTSRNDSLLLTGHNGAGKSSIFRCLAGLWKVKAGTITKPGGGSSTSLSGDVFYLPQKPYNVLGTLADQITYPTLAAAAGGEGGDSTMTVGYIRSLLEEVELGYLADRQGVLTEEVNWEEALSLGEKQRLAIARVIHHSPSFAILDECTSGVAHAMELKLYQLLNKRGISYITISHRPVLESMHCKRLCLNGDADKTYTYETLRTPEQLQVDLKTAEARHAVDVESANFYAQQRAAAAGVGGGGEVEENTMENKASLVKARSTAYEFVTRAREERKSAMVAEFASGSALMRLRQVLSGALPSGWQLKAGLIVGGIIGEVLLIDIGMQNVVGLFRALFQRDKAILYRYMARGVVTAVAQSVLHQGRTYVQKTLQVGLLESLTKKFMHKYSRKAGFYQLKTIDGRVTDPEARLSEDMQQFVEMLGALAMDVFEPAFKILTLGYRLSATIGLQDASMLYGYLFTAGVMARKVMPDFKAMVAANNAASAKLSFAHSTVRTHAESIAFFGGGTREKALVQSRLKEVLKVNRARLFADVSFSWFKQIFVQSMPDRVQQHLRFEYAVKNFNDADIEADGGAAISEGQHIIWDVQNNVKRSIQQIVEVSDKFNNLAGVIFRLAELDATLDELEVPAFLRAIDAQSKSVAAADDDSGASQRFIRDGAGKPEAPMLRIRNLDVVTPGAECLAKGVDVTVTPAKRLLVTGPNASGKTSFFRIVGQLWPSHPMGPRGGDLYGEVEGRVTVDGELFCVPQRVYSVSGTLLDQVTYPLHVPEARRDDPALLAHCEKLLELVGIKYLVTRDGGWHEVKKYEDVLSLGEQQRLGMARLFFRNPSFAILDECTDAVSVDVEEKLYREAVRMGICCVSISKRLALTEFHEQELRLGAANAVGFQLSNIQKTKN